jgi:hypothetical protein
MRHSLSILDLLPLPPGEGGGEGTRPLNMRCAFWGAGAGSSPRRASHFLCFAKESNQRKATPLSATPALRSGATCGARFSRGPRKLASLRQRAALIREKLRSSAQPEGSGSGLRFARPVEYQQPTQTTSTRHGAYVFNPLWACRGAQLQAAREAGIRSLRKAKLCGYQKGPRVFERSEFARTPPEASTAGCPQRSGGTRTVGSPFLCLLSFGEAKESESPAGARPGSRPQQGTATYRLEEATR